MITNLRPNEQRAKNAILILWVILALEIASVISGYLQYELLSVVADGGYITDEEADANDTRELIILVLYMLAYITSAVMFIQWFRRAYYNLHQKVGGLSYTEGWAAGAWFIPIANLYLPSKIMHELYEKTERLLKSHNLDNGYNLSTTVVSWWWLFWVITNIGGRIVFQISKGAEEVDEFILSTVAQLIVDTISIPLIFLAIFTIKNYAYAEPLLWQLDDEVPEFGSNTSQGNTHEENW